jgi:hypothetical protein
VTSASSSCARRSVSICAVICRHCAYWKHMLSIPEAGCWEGWLILYVTVCCVDGQTVVSGARQSRRVRPPWCVFCRGVGSWTMSNASLNCRHSGQDVFRTVWLFTTASITSRVDERRDYLPGFLPRIFDHFHLGFKYLFMAISLRVRNASWTRIFMLLLSRHV